MASKFHPLYSGVWTDPHLEGASFECHAFFAWLFSNDHVRPSGIYRVTDAQIAAETGLSLSRVRAYCQDLAQRRRIVRDGAWVFVCGYLKRQPNHKNLLKAAQSDVMACTSALILEAFQQKYPLYSRWSVDRLATVSPTVGQPMNEVRPSEQCSAVQSNAEQCSAVNHRPSSLLSSSKEPEPGDYRAAVERLGARVKGQA